MIFTNPSGAIFSEDRKYRYALWRMWDKEKDKVMFIGLNPSKANEFKPDPTITRVCSFAKTWGFGGVVMCNLYGYVSTDPDILLKQPDPIGEQDNWLSLASGHCSRIVFAWGSFKGTKERVNEVVAKFPYAMALLINMDGMPRHPLYVRGNTEPKLFSGAIPEPLIDTP